MDAKLKSKTHLQNMFFKFFELFLGQLALKFEKSANMTTTKIFIIKGIRKRRIDEHE